MVREGGAEERGYTLAVVVMAPRRIRARNKGIIGFPVFHASRINVSHGIAVALPFVALGVAPVQVRRTPVVILIRSSGKEVRALIRRPA